ncbi:ArsR family transcriptional regulator [Isoptericola jiangsuensis]|uniref:ArsR family transcriptional regulator n=1 Tax=Isoptericola jiangsuensis TaxID=548579 RepID=A0A2A9EVT8_9MICO|nr:metalloregulator ArsR/SmtB family transcription factor [Isoptericola jiangsuensis]PFG43008.1 ArsR family transcriptional regulator [Isoptericola jiangsuensis]
MTTRTTTAPGSPDAVFAALGDPVRRRLLLLLHDAGEATVGSLVAAVRAATAISQPAVSQHLRVLREAGLVRVRPDGTRRLYAVEPAGIDAARTWLATFTDPFAQPLDALGTEVARGRRERRRTGGVSGSPASGSSPADAARRGARRAG